MNKPVAWYKKDSNDYLIENIGQTDFQVQEFIDAGYIPLYTTPQTKPLSNNEILEMTIWNKNLYELYVEMEKEDMIAFARAIEERHGIK